MKISYIKTKDKTWYPQKAGVQVPKYREGYFYPVCYIKAISKGRYQIDYFDDSYIGVYNNAVDNQHPHSRKIIYPSGVLEVEFINDVYEPEPFNKD